MNLENHCGTKQQQVMAAILREVLGDKLYTDNVQTDIQYLPSPEYFKRKILVKVELFLVQLNKCCTVNSCNCFWPCQDHDGVCRQMMGRHMNG